MKQMIDWKRKGTPMSDLMSKARMKSEHVDCKQQLMLWVSVASEQSWRWTRIDSSRGVSGTRILWWKRARRQQTGVGRDLHAERLHLTELRVLRVAQPAEYYALWCAQEGARRPHQIERVHSFHTNSTIRNPIATKNNSLLAFALRSQRTKLFLILM